MNAEKERCMVGEDTSRSATYSHLFLLVSVFSR